MTQSSVCVCEGLPQLATKLLVPPLFYTHVTFLLRFFKHPPSLRVGRRRGSVLIWPGCMSGDNGPAANTRRPCSVFPREPWRCFAAALLIGEGKQEADFKKLTSPWRAPSLSVFTIVLKFERFGDVWSRKEICGRGVWCLIAKLVQGGKVLECCAIKGTVVANKATSAERHEGCGCVQKNADRWHTQAAFSFVFQSFSLENGPKEKRLLEAPFRKMEDGNSCSGCERHTIRTSSAWFEYIFSKLGLLKWIKYQDVLMEKQLSRCSMVNKWSLYG